MNMAPATEGDIELKLKTKAAHDSKDMRSFRPSSAKELMAFRGYQPLQIKYVTEEGGVTKTCDLCTQNSIADVFIISACFVCLWGFLIAFFALLLKAALLTDHNHVALWMYFWGSLLFAVLMNGAVFLGQADRKLAEDKAAAEV